MKKIILWINISLDGFIEGPNGEMDWISKDEEGWDDINDFKRTVDTILIGRVNYQGFVSYWPSAARSTTLPKSESDHARWIEDTHKIVLSKTLDKVEWKNSRLIKENIADEIKILKQQPGKDIVTFGGAGIASSLIDLNLIDEYLLKVHPVILGTGKSIFNPHKEDNKKRINLNLLKTKTFRSGVTQFHYKIQR
jgi:dihydrofolate reductase